MDSKSVIQIFVPVLILFSFILSIVLISFSFTKYVKIENENTTNKPGIFTGFILMIFTIFLLAIYLVGGNFYKFYGYFFFWIVGGVFLLCFIILLIGITNKNQDNFATGICMKNGEMGVNYGDGCFTESDRTKSEQQKKLEKKQNELDKCEKEKKKMSIFGSKIFEKPFDGLGSDIKKQKIFDRFGKEINSGKTFDRAKKIYDGLGKEINDKKFLDKIRETFRRNENRGDKLKMEKFGEEGCETSEMKEIIRRSQDIGICEHQVDGVNKFGYSHPYFGKRCVDGSRMDEMLKNHPEFSKIHKIKLQGFEINPFQSTQCFGFPPDDLVSYDIQCKKRFGNQYGLKNLVQTGCPPKDHRGICEIDYQMGVKLLPESTKCVPVGTDMNNVCQRKNLREKKTKFLQMGYKNIEFSGCPQGAQRAICDGNYYSGKELFKNSTNCFPESYDPDRKCMEKYGLLSTSQQIISDNCSPGNIRAVCRL